MLNMHELLLGRVRGLNHIRRYTSFPVLRPENVAEHGYWVAFYAAQIGLDLQARGVAVNMDRLLLKALLHDVEECISGDIVRTFKHSDKDLLAKIEEAGERAVDGLAGSLQGDGQAGATFLGLWCTAKSDGLEGRIVALCDFLSVLSYLAEERACGNNTYLMAELSKMPRKLESFLGYKELEPYILQALSVSRGLLKEFGMQEAKKDGGAL